MLQAPRPRSYWDRRFRTPRADGKLSTYLECAYITPDNNACENAVQPFVVRKNYVLFNQSPSGAKSSCAIYTLIETAKQNGLIPRNYLNLLFERCPLAKTPEDWAALLPGM